MGENINTSEGFLIEIKENNNLLQAVSDDYDYISIGKLLYRTGDYGIGFSNKKLVSASDFITVSPTDGSNKYHTYYSLAFAYNEKFNFRSFIYSASYNTKEIFKIIYIFDSPLPNEILWELI